MKGIIVYPADPHAGGSTRSCKTICSHETERAAWHGSACLLIEAIDVFYGLAAQLAILNGLRHQKVLCLLFGVCYIVCGSWLAGGRKTIGGV